MNVTTDPFRGMPYSQIMANLSANGRKAYHEYPHPVVSRQPVGELYWDAEIGRWVA